MAGGREDITVPKCADQEHTQNIEGLSKRNKVEHYDASFGCKYIHELNFICKKVT